MIPFELSTEESALVRGGFFRRSRENKGKTNMKQLKFMLAAATAFGIATAQADATDKKLVNENFNSYTADQVVTEITGFSFEGTEGDNESAIIKQAEGDMALKVNTGTDPLLRALDYNNNTGAQDLDFADEEAAINSVTIDTTVEFTVTPKGDTVAATDDDKLLIYLKEETVDEVKSYALRVMTAEYTPAQPSQRPGQDPVPAAFNRMDVKISNKTIEPNKPYSLQVTTKRDDDDVVYFEITLDGTKLQSATSLHPAGLDKFPSRVYEGEKVNTLTYVGFAGEGTVDDLVVTKNYNVPDAVDFTFVVKWDTGISAVAYTISEDGTTSEAAPVPADGFSVPEGATVELAVTLKDSEWTKLADGTVLKFENVAADKKDIELKTVSVSAEDLGVTVPEGTPADTTSAALAWAKNAGKSTTEVKAASNIINNYLLNVADLSKEPQIKIVEIDVSGEVPVVKAAVTEADGTTTIKELKSDAINGAIKYKTAAELKDLKTATPKAAIEDGDKFIQVVVE